MPHLLVQATLEPAAGFSDESVVNTFAFASEVTIDAAARLDILNAVAGFYNTLHFEAAATVASYLAGTLSRDVGGCSLKMYDITGHLDGSPAGSPIEDSTFTLGAAATADNMPTQTAAVITTRARGALDEPVEGPGGVRPRQRVSGRLFVGPLNESAFVSGSSDHRRFTTAFMGSLICAAEGLQDALVDGDYAWCVWSRTNADMIPIVRAECDDSPDVLRSRKINPTQRYVRNFDPVPDLILAA